MGYIKNNITFVLKLVALICLTSLLAHSKVLSQIQTLPDVKTNINKGWFYYENNTADIQELAKLNKKTLIDLPHTWNQYDVVDANPGYRRDASWYQKMMNISLNENERLFLSFEGSNITTDVYVNNKKAGQHAGGYVGFDIEITDFVKSNQANTISIRVDNGYDSNIIPSQKNDFFIYGGITRDLWLKKVPKTYIQHALVSSDVSVTRAITKVVAKLDGKIGPNLSVKTSIYENGSEKSVSDKTHKAINNEVIIDLPEIKKPKLWSPESPYLYNIITTLYDGKTKIHEVEHKIGYRWYSFDDNGPFYLNGKRLLLRGTHRHEEHAGMGAAMTNEQHRKDIELIKEVGANFLRLGHYPQDPEIYKTCNELGIIVWDELPWSRGGLGEDIWQANTKRLLKEQITQNYNHPSIFFWSLGNEIYWLPDFKNGDDKDRLNEFLTELNTMSHQLDPKRMTSIRKYYDGSNLVDVFSPSIWSGWYAGVYTNYEETIKKNQKLYPKFLHMEYGGSSHVGRHTENPITGQGNINENDWAEVSNQVNIQNIAKNGDWTENYIVDLFDWHLKISETMPQFTGNAQWAFKDFGTPLRPENDIPYMNQKGLVDRDGKPKDAFYVFKSYWSDQPFTYIESHTWTHRTGPLGKSREVNIYSNCTEVEFYHNSTSLGKRTKDISKFPASGLVWDVNFVEGVNKLKAIGYIDGKVVHEDDMEVTYTYTKARAPEEIIVTHEVDGSGKHFIVATMVDKAGNRVLDYEEKVYFNLNGAGKILKNHGTPTGSDIIAMANGRAVIQYFPAKGKTTIEVRNQDFKGSYLVINNDDDK